MNKYDVILKAHDEKYAIPQFNIIDVAYTRYILEECENNSSPVILGVSETIKNHLGGFNVVKNMVGSLIKDLNITVPVILHLDHGKTIEVVEEAIKVGFDSVMLDYSSKSLNENIEKIKYLREKYPNVIIECEIGSIGKNGNEGIKYADILDVIKLAKDTNVHMIAPAFGTVHGVYKGTPNINYELIDNINKELNIPLVMHGGSGLSHETFQKCIELGITKININTELKQAWTKAVRKILKEQENLFDPVKITKETEKGIKEVVKTLINVFGSNNKA